MTQRGGAAGGFIGVAFMAVAFMVAGVVWFFIWLFWIQDDPIHALPGICKMVALDSGRALGATCDPGMAWDARSKKCLASPCTVAGTVYNSNSKTCMKDPCGENTDWDSQSNTCTGSGIAGTGTVDDSTYDCDFRLVDVIADTKSKDWQPLTPSAGKNNMLLKNLKAEIEYLGITKSTFPCYYFDFDACNHILITEAEGCMSKTEHGEQIYQKCVWSDESYKARFEEKDALSVFLTPQIKEDTMVEFMAVFRYVLLVLCICGCLGLCRLVFQEVQQQTRNAYKIKNVVDQKRR